MDSRSRTQSTERKAGPRPALLLLLVILGGALWGFRWATASSHASGDTFWYTRQAFVYAGRADTEATALAADFIVRQGRGNDPGPWVAAARTVDQRYQAIFRARPVYPLIAAPFVGLVGADGMAIASFLSAVAFAVALGFLAWSIVGSSVASIAAVVAAFALPTGGWLAYLYADGWMLALWTASLAAGIAYVRSGMRSWLIAFAVFVAMLFLTKSANGAVLVIATIGAAAVVAIVERRIRTRATGLAAVAATIGLVQVVLFAVLHLPGLNQTLQDLWTNHFVRPDVTDPWLRLARRDLAMVRGIAVALIGQPIVVGVAAIGLAALATLHSFPGALLVIAGLSSVLTVLVHPVTSEIPRLMAPIWVSVAVGWAVLVWRVVERFRPAVGGERADRAELRSLP